MECNAYPEREKNKNKIIIITPYCCYYIDILTSILNSKQTHTHTHTTYTQSHMYIYTSINDPHKQLKAKRFMFTTYLLWKVKTEQFQWIFFLHNSYINLNFINCDMLHTYTKSTKISQQFNFFMFFFLTQRFLFTIGLLCAKSCFFFVIHQCAWGPIIFCCFCFFFCYFFFFFRLRLLFKMRAIYTAY